MLATGFLFVAVTGIVRHLGSDLPAVEAAFIGIPAVAVSLHIGDWKHGHWDRAAAHARRTLDRVLGGPVRQHSVVNMNVPILDDGAEPQGVKVVPISTSPMVMKYDVRRDGAAATYKVCNSMTFDHQQPDTDVEALYQRYITLTPLHFDLTLTEQMPAWADHFG